ncbi:hypothetical protein FIBSPDRAFT_851037 [Athelia psychrophila]|uniref:Uncharacterized protein n=1 Tax=Athelia psychrophila TaxID=1759441 RepID=A0A166SVB2_9AGAM|nr:hypothetical protein FIBSPDRAFT_851037 [Fibularhizoctonia sp. CBS 109695]
MVSGSLDVQAVALSFVPGVFLSSSSDLGLVNRLGDQSKRRTGDTVRGRRWRRCRRVVLDSANAELLRGCGWESEGDDGFRVKIRVRLLGRP